MTDLSHQMTCIGAIRKDFRILALLSLALCLVLAGTFAACLICDQDVCCEEGDHEDEEICACSCALHALMLVVEIPQHIVEAGDPPAERAWVIATAPTPSPYRPPRFTG